MSILLATDLDRTAVPNGSWPESPGVREKFTRLAEREEVKLVYISGRNIDLIRSALDKHSLPDPDYAVASVGTEIFEASEGGDWKAVEYWRQIIGIDWGDASWQSLRELFEQNEKDGAIWLQDDVAKAQREYKLSYYTDPKLDRDELVNRLTELAESRQAKVSVIWSLDPLKNVGLLDILPQSATKIGALLFLQKELGYDEDNTVFIGDSGNDLPAFTSGLKAVMVRNTPEAVQQKVRQWAKQNNQEDKIFLAKGNWRGLNGYYAGGLLEGVGHFFPETVEYW